MNKSAVVDVFLGYPLVDQTEKRFLERLRRDLSAQGVSAFVLANLQVGRRELRQLDFLILTDQRAVSCELKGYRQQLIGRANGRWSQVVAGRETPLEGNPFRQAHEATYALSDSMHSYAQRQSAPGPSKPKFYMDVDTCVCLFPEIPAGSTFQRYPHVKVLGYAQLLERLVTPGPRPPWSARDWDGFIRHLGAYREEEDSLEAANRRIAAAAADDYLGNLLPPFGGLAPLVSTTVKSDGQAVERPDLVSSLGRGESVVLVGESGVGKSHWASHTLVGLAKTGAVPIWISALSAESAFRTTLSRAVAPYTTLSANQLLQAAQFAGRSVVLVIDGLNEVSGQVREALLAGLQTIRLHVPSAAVLATAQAADQVGGLVTQATVITLQLPGDHEREQVLAAYGAPQLVDRSEAFRTPYELSLAAACSESLPTDVNVSQLLDLYVHAMAGGDKARDGLRTIAGAMHEEVRLSLAIPEASRLLRLKAGLDPEQTERLLESGLVTTAQGRLSFRHERLATFLAAEDLLLNASSAGELTTQLNKPLTGALRRDVMALESNPARLTALMSACTDVGVLAEACSGKLGAKAAEAARTALTAALTLASAQTTSEDIGFEPGQGLGFDGRWLLPWEDDLAHSAALAAVGECLQRGLFCQEVGRLLDQTEALFEQLQQAGVPAALLFAAAFVFQRSDGSGLLPAGRVVFACEHVSWRDAEPSAAAQAARYLVTSTPDPGLARLYAAMHLLRRAEAEDADVVVAVLNASLNSGPYHLRLQALELAQLFASRLVEPSRELILEKVRANLGDNLLFNSAVIDTLAAFGDIEPGRTVEDIHAEVNYVLDRADDPNAWQLASGIVSSQFEEEAVVGPYYEALSQLDPGDRQRLFALALRGGEVDSLHIAWAVNELADLDEPLVRGALIETLASLNPAGWHSVQSGINSTVAALSLLARENFDLPGPPSGVDPAWQCFVRLVWSSLCVNAGHQQRAAARDAAWAELASEHRDALADLMAHLHSARAMGSDSLPEVWEILSDQMPAPAVDALRWLLERPDELRSPFRFSHDTLRATVMLLGKVGNQQAATLLRQFVSDPALGREAIEAIREIDARA